MSQEKVIKKPLQQFVVQALQLEGDSLVEVIKQALDCVDTFVFAELLECPNVIALETTPHAPYLHALRMFSQGTYLNYLDKKEYLPELSEPQKKKLKYLTIVTLASRMKRIPYNVLLKELDVDNSRDLEDLIIEAIYSNVISGELNQQSDCLEVDWSVGRDVGSIDIDNMIDTLQQWCDSCENVLSTVEARIDDAYQTRHDTLKDSATVNNQVAKAKNAITNQIQDEEMSVNTSGPSKKIDRRMDPSSTKFCNKDKKIQIKILKPDNSYMKCIIKMNTPIKKLMRVYCLRARESSVRFRYDGLEMLGTDTPLTHELEDGDIIDAHHC